MPGGVVTTAGPRHQYAWAFVVASVWTGMWIILHMLYLDLNLIWPAHETLVQSLYLPVWLLFAYAFTRVARRAGARAIAWVGVTWWSVAAPLVIVLGNVKGGDHVNLGALALFLSPFVAAIAGTAAAMIRKSSLDPEGFPAPSSAPPRALMVVSSISTIVWLGIGGMLLFSQ